MLVVSCRQVHSFASRVVDDGHLHLLQDGGEGAIVIKSSPARDVRRLADEIVVVVRDAYWQNIGLERHWLVES